jgi:hypothetical protein
MFLTVYFVCLTFKSRLLSFSFFCWPNILIKWLTQLFRIWEVQCSNLGVETSYTHLGFLWFSSVPQGKCQDRTFYYAASFQILYSSSFTYRPFLRRSIDWVTEKKMSLNKLKTFILIYFLIRLIFSFCLLVFVFFSLLFFRSSFIFFMPSCLAFSFPSPFSAFSLSFFLFHFSQDSIYSFNTVRMLTQMWVFATTSRHYERKSEELPISLLGCFCYRFMRKQPLKCTTANRCWVRYC